MRPTTGVCTTTLPHESWPDLQTIEIVQAAESAEEHKNFVKYDYAYRPSKPASLLRSPTSTAIKKQDRGHYQCSSPQEYISAAFLFGNGKLLWEIFETPS